MPAVRAEHAPLAYSLTDAAAVAGVSRSTIDRLIAADELHPRYINSKRVITADELKAFINSLPFDRPEVIS